jgi:hypothetical protein
VKQLFLENPVDGNTIIVMVEQLSLYSVQVSVSLKERDRVKGCYYPGNDDDNDCNEKSKTA